MPRFPVALALILILTACGSPDQDASPPEASGEVAAGFGDPIAGEITAMETSSKGEIEMGVTDEVLFFRLSEAARSEARKEIEDGGDEGGLGGAITDMVGGVVNKALATTVQMPLATVTDLRYEGGHLIIDTDDTGIDINVGDGDVQNEGIPFDEDAAQRLIEAYQAAR